MHRSARYFPPVLKIKGPFRRSRLSRDPETKLRYLAYDRIIMTRFSMVQILGSDSPIFRLDSNQNRNKGLKKSHFSIMRIDPEFRSLFGVFFDETKIDLTPTVRYRCSTDNWIASDTSRFGKTVSCQLFDKIRLLRTGNL